MSNIQFFDLTEEPETPAVVVNESVNVQIYSVPGATIIEVKDK